MKTALLFALCIVTASAQQWMKFYNHCEFDVAMINYDENGNPQNSTVRGRGIHCEDISVGEWDYRFGSYGFVVTTKPTFTQYGIYADTFDFPIQVRPIWNSNRRISGKKLKCDSPNCDDVSWNDSDLSNKTYTTKGEQMEITFCYDMYMEFLQCPAIRSTKDRDYED